MGVTTLAVYMLDVCLPDNPHRCWTVGICHHYGGDVLLPSQLS